MYCYSGGGEAVRSLYREGQITVYQSGYYYYSTAYLPRAAGRTAGVRIGGEYQLRNTRI